jgi:hypothetical protein
MQGDSVGEWISSLSIWVVGLGTLAAMMVAGAAGHIFRRWQTRSPSNVVESGESIAQEGYLLGSALGLLGLLIAFTFGLVLNRYEARRDLVTREANSLGTAYLRTQLLDEPHRSRLSGLIVGYTQDRVRIASADREPGALVARNDQRLVEIWSAVRAARESAAAHGVTTALLMAFNEVIDIDTERKVALALRVPGEVLLLLLVFLTITAAVAGHQIDGPRGRRAAILLFLLASLSISVMTDINRPSSGHERQSQQAMLMLLQTLKAQPPGTFDTFLSPPAPPERRPQ